jgi:hypothetical protein
MSPAQKIVNVGDLVRWKAIVMSPAVYSQTKRVEALGIVRKLIGTNTVELKVINANVACSEYLNALDTLSSWHRLPVNIRECEVLA